MNGVNIPQQSWGLYDCWPLKGAYPQSQKNLIPLHPPLSKGGKISPPFGKGRLGGILQNDFKQFIFPKMSNSASPPAEPGVYLITN